MVSDCKGSDSNSFSMLGQFNQPFTFLPDLRCYSRNTSIHANLMGFRFKLSPHNKLRFPRPHWSQIAQVLIQTQSSFLSFSFKLSSISSVQSVFSAWIEILQLEHQYTSRSEMIIFRSGTQVYMQIWNAHFRISSISLLVATAGTQVSSVSDSNSALITNLDSQSHT